MNNQLLKEFTQAVLAVEPQYSDAFGTFGGGSGSSSGVSHASVDVVNKMRRQVAGFTRLCVQAQPVATEVKKSAGEIDASLLVAHTFGVITDATLQKLRDQLQDVVAVYT